MERLNPRDAADSWQFRVREGVARVRFGDPGWRIGYAREAINSYFVFKTLREKGVLARHLRFQVSLPSVNSALPPRIFPDAADVAKVRPGFTEALAAEIDTIVAKIPDEDLAIQWDCATEVQDAYGAIPGYRPKARSRAISSSSARCRRTCRRTVMLGYHFCFGTLGGWPRFAPPISRRRSQLANAVVEGSGRRVDWIHIPVLDGADEVLCAAGNLKPQRRPRLSRRHPPHGRLRRAGRGGAQISARVRGCGLLRLRPHAARRCRPCSRSISRRSRRRVRARLFEA